MSSLFFPRHPWSHVTLHWRTLHQSSLWTSRLHLTENEAQRYFLIKQILFCNNRNSSWTNFLTKCARSISWKSLKTPTRFTGSRNRVSMQEFLTGKGFFQTSNFGITTRLTFTIRLWLGDRTNERHRVLTAHHQCQKTTP